MDISADQGLLGPRDALDYYHTAFVDLPVAVTPLEGWNIITGAPNPLLQLAFDIRDGISAMFGVQKIAGFSGKQMTDVQVGDHLDFFLVEHSAPDMLVLTARDGKSQIDRMTLLAPPNYEGSFTMGRPGNDLSITEVFYQETSGTGR